MKAETLKELGFHQHGVHTHTPLRWSQRRIALSGEERVRDVKVVRCGATYRVLTR